MLVLRLTLRYLLLRNSLRLVTLPLYVMLQVLVVSKTIIKYDATFWHILHKFVVVVVVVYCKKCRVCCLFVVQIFLAFVYEILISIQITHFTKLFYNIN